MKAFPSATGLKQVEEGMDLRDWFAAHATEEDILAHIGKVDFVELVKEMPSGRKKLTLGLPKNAREIAKFIYADAMMAARSKN